MRRFIAVAALTMMATLLGSIRATAETAVPIARISNAWAGGNFRQHYGAFVVLYRR